MYNIIPTAIPDVLIIEPKIFRDSRGFFTELFNKQKFEDLGLGHLNFVQDNLSTSQKGTIRGLHFQSPPYAQGKMVTVFQGCVLDVAVDLRKNSPTFGQHVAVELDADNLRYLFIPEGFAHGFQVLSENCIFYYKCTNYYNAPADGGVFWNDPALNLPWREIEPIVSEKDAKQPLLANLNSPF
jgi:dTDP-4-dehydrorhamnose 3,5-epimerase